MPGEKKTTTVTEEETDVVDVTDVIADPASPEELRLSLARLQRADQQQVLQKEVAVVLDNPELTEGL